MSCTVYANGDGLFHKGSGGKGIAPADVCLSPPPPPAGPVPVPYVNNLSAADLADGSTTVMIQGEPTALEDQSSISTSTGDEGGTQGGNVVTHKTKGKGYFTTWSSDVKVEGKGVCRHNDMMGQNCASSPPGCVDMSALTTFLVRTDVEIKPCTKPFDRKKIQSSTNEKQKEHVRGGPCWECVRDAPATNWAKSPYVGGRKDSQYFTPDHQPPMNIAWYMGGCHMKEEDFKEWANSTQAVKPHCSAHSSSQGGQMSSLGKGGEQAAFDKTIAFLGF